MNLAKIGKTGTTTGRKQFWDSIADTVYSLQKLPGDNVTVNEILGQGTVITADRKSGTGTGACCTDGVCGITTQADCESGDGDYLGNGTTCDGVDCTQGACCYSDGSCFVLSATDCTDSGGTFQGFGTDCDPNPCPSGACCFDDGSCLTETSGQCALDGGHYQGDGTTCDGVDCSHGGPGTSGACCTGIFCNIESPVDCFNSGGTYQGDDTTCDPNPCLGATGACCTPDNILGPRCLNNVTSTECAIDGGFYYGDGTTCSSPGVPIGCCCIYESPCSCGEFSGATQECCEASGGTFTAVGSGLCGDIHGACCFFDGAFWECLQKEEIECTCLGGTFNGIGSSTCADCPPP